MTFGVTIDGFNKKTVDDILDDIADYQQTNIAQGLASKSADSIIGQLNSSLADPIRELWDVSEEVYRSMYPDSATGDAQDNVCATTGVYRQPATYTTVDVTVNLDAATTIPIGSQVAIPDPVGTVFENLTALTSVGAGDYTLEFTALTTGPIQAPSGSVTEIVTAITGWNTANNPLDGESGRNIETDEALRSRRELLLHGAGAGTKAAILTDVSNVVGVTQTSIFENTCYTTNDNGLPAKSFEIVALGGVDLDIGTAIWNSKPIGIETYGTTTVSVSSNDVSFSRPVDVNIYSAVTVTVDATKYPADGDEQIKQALVDLGDQTLIGQDLIIEVYKCAIFQVAGVLDIPAFTLDTITPSVNTANLEITNRQIAVFDTSRITVTS